MIVTGVLLVLGLAAVGYVLVSRVKGQPVNTRRLLVLPAVLTAMGALQLCGELSAGLRPMDVVLLMVGLLAAVGLGAARGATVAVFVRNGRSWLRYRPGTLGMWVATVAVRVGLTVAAHTAGAMVARGGPALLFTVGMTLLAEGVVVAGRAGSLGGRRWQAGVTQMHSALH